jgi:hypothetical protein
MTVANLFKYKSLMHRNASTEDPNNRIEYFLYAYHKGLTYPNSILDHLRRSVVYYCSYASLPLFTTSSVSPEPSFRFPSIPSVNFHFSTLCRTLSLLLVNGSKN